MCQFPLAFLYLEMLQKVNNISELLTAVVNCFMSVVGSDVKLVSLGDEVAGTACICSCYWHTCALNVTL